MTEMIENINLPYYIMSVCKHMNPRLFIAYNVQLSLNSGNDKDRKSVKDRVFGNDIDSVDDAILYYHIKAIQIDDKIASTKEGDIATALNNETVCQTIFKEVILDDTPYLESKNKKKEET